VMCTMGNIAKGVVLEWRLRSRKDLEGMCGEDAKCESRTVLELDRVTGVYPYTFNMILSSSDLRLLRRPRQ
jgi:hypothetical protein